MTKTLLIVSGGEAAADLARHAKEMGATIVMSDADPRAPGFAFADSCLIADAYAPAETAAAAERYSRKIRKIDGVIGIEAQAPLTVATVAQRLRLPGLPVHVAELVQDRLAIKKCFVSAGIAAPWSAEIHTLQELQRAVIAHGRDLLIAPVDGHGEAGVQRLAPLEDLAGAFQLARSHSPSERVMVEKCLESTRLCASFLVTNGGCFTPCLWNADEDETLGRLAEEILAPARDLVARAAGAVGISDGVIVADIAMHQGQPHILTLGACLRGNEKTRTGTGFDLFGAAIRLALGEPPGTAEG